MPRLSIACLMLTVGAGCGRFGYDAPGGDGGAVGDDDVDASGADDGGAPFDGGELPGDELPVGGGAGAAHLPTLMWTGDGFMLVWQDEVGGTPQVRSAHLEENGAVEAGPFNLTASVGGGGRAPGAAWSGTQLGVAWLDERSGGPETYFARYGENGVIIGSDGPVSQTNMDTDHPAVAWSGAGFAVSWDQGSVNSSEVMLQRVEVSGALQGTPIQRSNAAGASADASLVWSGGEWALAWQDERAGGVLSVWFSRIGSDGNLTATEVRQTDGAAVAQQTSLASTGSGYAVAWQDARGGVPAIYFARVDTQGSKVGVDLLVSTGAATASDPSLVWTGDHFGLAWSQAGAIWLLELGGSGSPMGAPQIIAGASAGDSTHPSLQWTGTGWAVAWEENLNASSEIYVKVVP